jgi:hypothetical protein
MLLFYIDAFFHDRETAIYVSLLPLPQGVKHCFILSMIPYFCRFVKYILFLYNYLSEKIHINCKKSSPDKNITWEMLSVKGKQQ